MQNVPTLVITNKNYSSWSLRAWWALREMGFEFQERLVPMDQNFEPSLEGLKVAGKLPVLLTPEVTIWDSLAICEFAHESTGRGWPTNPIARAQARAVVAEVHSSFPSLRQQWPFNLRLKTNMVRKPDVYSEIRRIQELTRWIQGPYIFGDFSIADSFLGVTLLRLRCYGHNLAPEYLGRLLERPSLQEWIAAAHSETEFIEKYEVCGESSLDPL